MESNKLNKSESKYYNTACLMDEALICLLEKKELTYITVKEICKKAGVNRSTFYLHYETIEDLLSECIEYIGKKIVLKYKNETINIVDINNSSTEDLIFINHKYLLPYLEFVKENKRVYIAAYSQPTVLKTKEITQHLYRNVFKPILNKFKIQEKEQKFIMAFYLNGVSAIIIEWIKNGCKEEIKDVADIIIKCLNIEKTKKS